MSIHIASINGLNFLPNEYVRAKAREGVIHQMASHLVAGAAGGLDLMNDSDVIKYLFDVPERYRWAVVRDHLDAALDEAQRIIVTAEMVQR